MSRVTVTVLRRPFRFIPQVTFDDGSTAQARVSPSVFQVNPAAIPVVGAPTVERLIGYGGLHKLAVKQDYLTHKLVRRVRRV